MVKKEFHTIGKLPLSTVLVLIPSIIGLLFGIWERFIKVETKMDFSTTQIHAQELEPRVQNLEFDVTKIEVCLTESKQDVSNLKVRMSELDKGQEQIINSLNSLCTEMRTDRRQIQQTLNDILLGLSKQK